jgi:hypothetical protein
MSFRGEEQLPGGEELTCDITPAQAARIRLSGELSENSYGLQRALDVMDVARKYEIDLSYAFRVLSDLQTLGMVTVGPKHSAIIRSQGNAGSL